MMGEKVVQLLVDVLVEDVNIVSLHHKHLMKHLHLLEDHNVNFLNK